MATDIREILEQHGLWIDNPRNGRRADLCDADLYRADLCGANLRGADLHGANLYRADLHDANLCDANLRGADLHDADLHGADLYRADLCDADLYRADLCGANLCDANLRGAHGILVIGPGGSRGDFIYAVEHIKGYMLSVGCSWFDLDSFTDAVHITHGDNNYGRYYAAVITMLRSCQAEYLAQGR